MYIIKYTHENDSCVQQGIDIFFSHTTYFTMLRYILGQSLGLFSKLNMTEYLAQPNIPTFQYTIEIFSSPYPPVKPVS